MAYVKPEITPTPEGGSAAPPNIREGGSLRRGMSGPGEIGVDTSSEAGRRVEEQKAGGDRAEEVQPGSVFRVQVARLSANYQALKVGEQTPYVLNGFLFTESSSAEPQADEERGAKPPSKEILLQAEQQASRHVRYIEAIGNGDTPPFIRIFDPKSGLPSYFTPGEISQMLIEEGNRLHDLQVNSVFLEAHIGAYTKMLEFPYYSQNPQARQLEEQNLQKLNKDLELLKAKLGTMQKNLAIYRQSLDAHTRGKTLPTLDVQKMLELFKGQLPASVNEESAKKMFYGVQGYMYFDGMIRSATSNGEAKPPPYVHRGGLLFQEKHIPNIIEALEGKKATLVGALGNVTRGLESIAKLTGSNIEDEALRNILKGAEGSIEELTTQIDILSGRTKSTRAGTLYENPSAIQKEGQGAQNVDGNAIQVAQEVGSGQTPKEQKAEGKTAQQAQEAGAEGDKAQNAQNAKGNEAQNAQIAKGDEAQNAQNARGDKAQKAQDAEGDEAQNAQIAKGDKAQNAQNAKGDEAQSAQVALVRESILGRIARGFFAFLSRFKLEDLIKALKLDKLRIPNPNLSARSLLQALSYAMKAKVKSGGLDMSAIGRNERPYIECQKLDDLIRIAGGGNMRTDEGKKFLRRFEDYIYAIRNNEKPKYSFDGIRFNARRDEQSSSPQNQSTQPQLTPEQEDALRNESVRVIGQAGRHIQYLMRIEQGLKPGFLQAVERKVLRDGRVIFRPLYYTEQEFADPNMVVQETLIENKHGGDENLRKNIQAAVTFISERLRIPRREARKLFYLGQAHMFFRGEYGRMIKGYGVAFSPNYGFIQHEGLYLPQDLFDENRRKAMLRRSRFFRI